MATQYKVHSVVLPDSIKDKYTIDKTKIRFESANGGSTALLPYNAFVDKNGNEVKYNTAEYMEIDAALKSNGYSLTYEKADNGFKVYFGNPITKSSPTSTSSSYPTYPTDGINILNVGDGNYCGGNYSMAFGKENTLNGVYSTAFGLNNTVENNYAFVAGRDNSATDNFSTAFGGYNTISGTYSFVEGSNNKIQNSSSSAHCEGGYNTITNGSYTHCEGYLNTVSNSYAHCEGFNGVASGARSHCEGSGGTASNLDSHAQGVNCTASGIASFAGGYKSTASGMYSTALGEGCQATADRSTAVGLYTTANLKGQFVCGTYNTPNTSMLFIVGNGSNSTATSNALTLSTAGALSTSGGITAQGKITGTTAQFTGGQSTFTSIKTTAGINGGSYITAPTMITTDGFITAGDNINCGGQFNFADCESGQSYKRTRESNVSITNNTWTNITGTQMTIPATGTYVLQGVIQFVANSTGMRLGRFYETTGSTAWTSTSVRVPACSSGATKISITGIGAFKKSQKVILQASQTTGSALNVDYAQIRMVYVGTADSTEELSS